MQLSEQGHIELFDLTCLWIYLSEKLGNKFTDDVVKRHAQLFYDGYFVIPSVELFHPSSIKMIGVAENIWPYDPKCDWFKMWCGFHKLRHNLPADGQPIMDTPPQFSIKFSSPPGTPRHDVVRGNCVAILALTDLQSCVCAKSGPPFHDWYAHNLGFCDAVWGDCVTFCM